MSAIILCLLYILCSTVHCIVFLESVNIMYILCSTVHCIVFLESVNIMYILCSTVHCIVFLESVNIMYILCSTVHCIVFLESVSIKHILYTARYRERYHIAAFAGQNFRKLLENRYSPEKHHKFAVTQCTTYTSVVSNCLKINFHWENFCESPQKCEIHESFLPRKKPAIRYHTASTSVYTLEADNLHAHTCSNAYYTSMCTFQIMHT